MDGKWEDDGKRNDGMNQSGGVDFRDFTPNDPITGLVQCSTQHFSEYTSANNVQLCIDSTMMRLCCILITRSWSDSLRLISAW